MIGRRSILSLSLLSVLALCAFGAQNAFAWETASNLTVFECSATATTKDYSDAHCDNPAAPQSNFGHKSITAGTSTPIETSNAATKNNTTEAEKAVLTGELLGASVKITANTVSPDPTTSSFVKNIATGDFEGTSAVNFTGITLEGNGSSLGCHVEEPITLASLFHGVEQGAAGSREMALEFSPDPSTSTTFVTIHFAGTGCLVTTATVKGKARGTGSGTGGNGATLKFLPADEELTFGGNPATFSGTFTTKVTSTGSALATTTTP
jgi:hypothetical protein